MEKEKNAAIEELRKVNKEKNDLYWEKSMLMNKNEKMEKEVKSLSEQIDKIQGMNEELVAEKMESKQSEFVTNGDEILKMKEMIKRLKRENKQYVEKIGTLKGNGDEVKNGDDFEAVDDDKCALKFKEWLFDVVKLKQYLTNFEENECNDIRMIEDLDEETIKEDIGIKKKLHCKLILRKAKQFKQGQMEFNNILNSNKELKRYKQIFEDNGILTLQNLHRDVGKILELGKMLKITDEGELNVVWGLLYSNSTAVSQITFEEGQETENH